MNPKIIQIAVESASEETDTALFALTDDGRVFVKQKIGYHGHKMDHMNEQPWQQVEPIPFENWEQE